ncbi:unnamed protein product [Auanema sp. JU1783]|nr:unnamed protein product [Auanema sp. JU1783]
MRKLAPEPHDFRDHKQHMIWLADRETYSPVPLIPNDMSGGSKAVSASVLQKAFSNPFVPIGMIATCGCLIGMLGATLKRNSKRAQFYMRGRVVAQGITVASLVCGAMWFGLTPGNGAKPIARTALPQEQQAEK